jgi:hypothetical protein
MIDASGSYITLGIGGIDTVSLEPYGAPSRETTAILVVCCSRGVWPRPNNANEVLPPRLGVRSAARSASSGIVCDPA